MVRGRRLRVFLALEEVRLGRPFRARVGGLCQPRASPWATMGCPVGTTGRGTVTQAPWNDEIMRSSDWLCDSAALPLCGEVRKRWGLLLKIEENPSKTARQLWLRLGTQVFPARSKVWSAYHSGLLRELNGVA